MDHLEHLALLEKHIAFLEGYIERLHEERMSVQRSRSWRLTRPLRGLVRIARGLGGRFRGFGHRFGISERIAGGLAGEQTPELSAPSVEGARQADYEAWVARYDSLSGSDLDRLASAGGELDWQPVFSILVICRDPKSDWLSETIRSALVQTYPKLELVVCHAGLDDHAASAVREAERTDKRVKQVELSGDPRYCALANEALKHASGEFTALLGQHDVLSPDALFQVARAIQANRSAQLVYADEDVISAASGRSDPYFKPDFNYQLLLSHNLFGPLSIARTELARRAGGCRPDQKGLEGWDLALRCVERVSRSEIVHVPFVLCHVRDEASEASAASGGADAGGAERIVAEHLARVSKPATVETLASGSVRVRYGLPAHPPLVSIIIPTRNRVELLRPCILSLVELTLYPSYEIIVVDNGSDDAETVLFLRHAQRTWPVTVIRDDRPFNYSALNNVAARRARGSVLALLNNDIEATGGDWLSEMVSFAVQPDVGAVGARLWYPDATLQHGGVIVGLGGGASHAHTGLPKGELGYKSRAGVAQDLSAVTTACLAVEKRKYFEVGGLNEEVLQVAYNDVDFCLKLVRAGYRNVWTPHAELLHRESASRGRDVSAAQKARHAIELTYLQSAWADILRADPAYNPNLTLAAADFSLAWPPRVRRVPDHALRPRGAVGSRGPGVGSSAGMVRLHRGPWPGS